MVHIEHLVYLVRGERIMLDSDLAVIYGVETKVLNQAVERNLKRFPDDFMFQLKQDEWDTLRSQFVTSNNREARGGRRYEPYAYTEHGAVMPDSVLKSPQAIAASVQVVRVFAKLREILAKHKQLADKLKALEDKYDNQFQEVFAALRELMEVPKEKTQRLILKIGIKE